MQQTSLCLETSGSAHPYPWELSEETRRVGRAGLATTRAILDATRAASVPLVLRLRPDEPTREAARLAA
jgi:hypothetical protein